MQGTRMKSVDAGSRTFGVSVGLVILLIVYGSLYPFRWNFAEPQAFIWIGPVGWVDLVENVLLFLPLGVLLGWACRGSAVPRWRHFSLGILLALVVAGSLQWLQKYLPRTPALSDVVFNMAGYGLGWFWGGVARSRIGHALQSERHRHWTHADRFALALIALWLLAELYPLIPTFDVSSVVQNVKSLWQQPIWQPRRMGLHAGMTVMGLTAVAQLARSAGLAHRARQWALMVVLMVLAGNFLVVDQIPGVAVLAGIAGGGLLWRWMDGWTEGPRWGAAASVALATYLLEALWPLQWRDPPAAMSWLPFASSLSTSVQSAVTVRAFECLCFGTIIWSTVRHGALLVGMTVCTALLAFACEWTQRYLPMRTAEITSVWLALGMGWLVSVCSPPGHGPRDKRTSGRP